ncbi:adenine deaminase [Ancylobacter dichloromethanicus]|uniref:Adenine deaminase n=1 Tax=Ancylobacter dichloromethanicus TaxID=518825 RepID=A0A9W6N1J3_9HYPH|nr:adenine deaminase [Ancylobacter dichloromethanicus]MBS7552360.1 adenine deaminase [Ancylobacter dichloromethanicus]GLK74097.1 adenine deaminase 1 [Ancylobacter dichloromethanicus]
MATQSPAAIARFIEAGRGTAPADLVIRGVRLLDVITGTITQTDIAMVGERIVGTYGSYQGAREIDGAGLFAVPGFIDTHLHVESSLVTPLEFDRCVLPHGITTAICDPHEIANVLGMEGIAYFQRCAEHTIMDLRVQLSSCVPATSFETAGAELAAPDLALLRGHQSGIGLAEFMNFPGVLFADEGCLAKLSLFSDGHIDGHAPLLRGLDLNGYIAAGIRTEHEATSLEEAREKLMKGMSVLIREGSVSKDLHALIPLITPDTSAFLGFCTDDRNPLDIAEEGHLDYMIREAIRHGAPLHHVYRVASWSAANAFGLRDRGLIAPGRRADIVLVDDLQACSVRHVISAGRLVTPELFAARGSVAPVGLDSVKARTVTAADFAIPAHERATRVIGVVPGRIITEDLHFDLELVGGEKQVDLEKDAVKVCVVERHGRNGNVGRGFVHGFGMKRGAIASSVGHDSHNITVVGVDEADMALAVNRLIALRGGFAVAQGGVVTAELALPVAGLMADTSFEEVHDALIPLRAAAKALGVVLAEPFLQVAFLPLPVIPHLKITDFGMFDVDAFALLESQRPPAGNG